MHKNFQFSSTQGKTALTAQRDICRLGVVLPHLAGKILRAIFSPTLVIFSRFFPPCWGALLTFQSILVTFAQFSVNFSQFW